MGLFLQMILLPFSILDYQTDTSELEFCECWTNEQVDVCEKALKNIAAVCP